ncbi:MAG TPA: DUF1801 domain-containing protein [Candidatus Saccharimonadales bacterium]|nr:DUF1801 domain-containing protein [Candidatus Saccharimonadales bacterium]
MQSKAKTPDKYLASLPEQRREAISTVREFIKQHLPKGYEEGMNYGMICYYIPLERYPNTYNGQPLQYVALASQKNYMSLYLMSVYGDMESDFRQKYADTGKKLDMGKSCIRFKSVDELALDVIGEAIKSTTPEQYIALYEKSRAKT